MLERDDAGEAGGIKERLPNMRTECERRGEREHSHCSRRGCEGAPAAARCQHNWDQQAVLRLVGKKPKQNPGQQRPTVELDQRRAEQRGGEEAILAMTDIDENRREGKCKQEPEGTDGRISFPLKRAVDRGGGPGRHSQNCTDRQEIKAKRDGLPDRERDAVRH